MFKFIESLLGKLFKFIKSLSGKLLKIIAAFNRSTPRNDNISDEVNSDSGENGRVPITNVEVEPNSQVVQNSQMVIIDKSHWYKFWNWFLALESSAKVKSYMVIQDEEKKSQFKGSYNAFWYSVALFYPLFNWKILKFLLLI